MANRDISLTPILAASIPAHTLAEAPEITREAILPQYYVTVQFIKHEEKNKLT